MSKFVKTFYMFAIVLPLLFGCVCTKESRSDVTKEPTGLAFGPTYPVNTNIEFSVSYRDPYEGELPQYDIDDLPEEALLQDGNTFSLFGSVYTAMEVPKNQVQTILSCGWKLRLDALTPIAVIKPATVVFASQENGNSDLMFLYVREEDTGVSRWLTRDDCSLGEVLNLDMDSFDVYSDGKVSDDMQFARRIWNYHTSFSFAEPDYLLLDGDWQVDSLLFVCRECPALTYEIQFGICGDKLYMENLANQITIGIPLQDVFE